VDLCSDGENFIISIVDSEDECEPNFGQDATNFTSKIPSSTFRQRGEDCPSVAQPASNNGDIYDSSDDELAKLSKKERLRVTKEKWQASLVVKREAEVETVPPRQPDDKKDDKKTTIKQQFKAQIKLAAQGRLDSKVKEERHYEQNPTGRVQTGFGDTVRNRRCEPDSESRHGIDLSKTIWSQKAPPCGSVKPSQNRESVNLSKPGSGARSAQSLSRAATLTPPEKDTFSTVSSSITDLPVVSNKRFSIESSGDESVVERVARLEESREIINVDSDSDDSNGETLPVARFVSKTYCQLQREHQQKNSPQPLQQKMDCEIPLLRTSSCHGVLPRHRARMNQQADSDFYALGRKGNTSSRLHQGLQKRGEKQRHKMGVTRNIFKMECGVRELLKGPQAGKTSPVIEQASNAPAIPIDKKSDQYTLSDILGDQDCLKLAGRGVTTAQQLENRMKEPELQDLYFRFLCGVKRRREKTVDKFVDLSEDVETSVETRKEQFSLSFRNAVVLQSNGEKVLTTRNSEYQPHELVSITSRERIQDHAESMNTLSATKWIATDRINALGAPIDKVTSHCKNPTQKSDDTVRDTLCYSAQEKQISHASFVPPTTMMIPTGPQIEMQSSALCLNQRNIGTDSFHPRGKTLAVPKIKPSESPSKNQLDSSKARIESQHVDDLSFSCEQNGREHCKNDGPADFTTHDGVLPATTFELDEHPDLEFIDHISLKIEPVFENVVCCQEKRVRARVNYEDPEDIVLTADSYISYSSVTEPALKSRVVEVQDEGRKVGHSADQTRPRRGRPRQSNPKECRGLEQVNEVCGIDERPPLMEPVPHLSFKTFDKTTNLPREIISVFSGFDGKFWVRV
jgi:hypothetical protein